MNLSGARLWAYLGLLWLAGNCLRMTVLAVPPLLPTIHRDLHLNETMVGALTALPIVLLAVAAVPGSLLVARVGARRALILGLLLVAMAGAARGAGSSPLVLFAMTLLMGVGIAVSQPSLPSLVKQWFPSRTGLATAVYSNGFLMGEILAASLTIPLVLPLVGNSWQLVFPLWSVPVVLTALALALWTPHLPRRPGAVPPAWWPDWRSAQTWRAGLILGCASVSYFGSNAFIPDYLKATHHRDLIALALTSLNLSQLPASLLVGAMAGRVIGRPWPIAAAGAVIALVTLSVLHLGGTWVVISAAFIGFCSGLVFVLSLALPPLLAGEHDVHRLSAAMFTISYTCSFAGSLLGGAVWDATGIPISAFAPVATAGALMTVLVVGLNVHAVAVPSVPVSDGIRDP